MMAIQAINGKTNMITKVSIYRDGGQWCYAAFAGREFDHSDVLDVESETDARTEVSVFFPVAKVIRVADAK